MFLRIIVLLFLLITGLSCNEKESLFRVANVQVSHALTINYNNFESFPLSGSCYQITDIQITIQNNIFYTSCDNNKWNITLDLSILADGKHQLEIAGKGKNAEWIKFKDHSLTKNIRRPNQISSFSTASITTIANLTSLKLSNGTHIVIYASDEFCMNPKCGVTNLTLRSSLDNYKSASFITKNTSIDSSSPSIVEKNGKIHLTYLSNERDRKIFDVIYSQIDPFTFAELNRVNLTPNLSRSAINPFLRKTQNNQIHLTYISDEYCQLNSCSFNKVSYRSDLDQFHSIKFYGEEIATEIYDHRFYTNPLSNKLYLVYGMSTTVGGINTIYTRIEEDGTFSHQSLNLPHRFSSVALVVDSQDKATLFFATSNTSLGCSGWKLAMKTSADNWSTQTNLPDTCVYGGSYAGITHTPFVYADDSDVIHLIYGTTDRTDTNGYALSYKKSVDNFQGTINISEDYFSDVRSISAIKETDHFKITFTGNGHYSGGLKLVNSFPGSVTQLISPSFTPKPILHFHEDKLYVISQSDDYCKQSGTCSRKNLILEDLASGNKSFLTYFTDPQIYISNPKLIFKNNEKILFYETSENLITHQSISYRSSTDNFTTSKELTNFPATLATILVDSNNEMKTTYSTTTGSKKTHYLETLSASPIVLPPGESFHSILKYHDQTDRSAIIYNGNESGWLTSLRTSDDNFSSYKRIDGAISNNGYNAYFTPAGVLHTLSVFDPEETGKNGLVVRSDTDGFVGTSFLLETSEGSVCVQTPYVEFDSAGTLHLTYSLKKDGEKFCNIWYSNSSDWGVKHQLTFSQNSDNTPSYLFIQSDNKAIICGGSAFNLDCFKPL